MLHNTLHRCLRDSLLLGERNRTRNTENEQEQDCQLSNCHSFSQQCHLTWKKKPLFAQAIPAFEPLGGWRELTRTSTADETAFTPTRRSQRSLQFRARSLHRRCQDALSSAHG